MRIPTHRLEEECELSGLFSLQDWSSHYTNSWSSKRFWLSLVAGLPISFFQPYCLTGNRLICKLWQITLIETVLGLFSCEWNFRFWIVPECYLAPNSVLRFTWVVDFTALHALHEYSCCNEPLEPCSNSVETFGFWHPAWNSCRLVLPGNKKENFDFPEDAPLSDLYKQFEKARFNIQQFCIQFLLLLLIGSEVYCFFADYWEEEGQYECSLWRTSLASK